MRSRPRTVMRSAAPGPAPMKCTVTGRPRCRQGRRSPARPRSAERAGAPPARRPRARPLRRPTARRPARGRAPIASRCARLPPQDRPAATVTSGTPMERGRCDDAGLAALGRRCRDEPNRCDPEPGTGERSRDRRLDLAPPRVPRRHPTPATIMASPMPIASPASPDATPSAIAHGKGADRLGAAKRRFGPARRRARRDGRAAGLRSRASPH